MICLRLSVAPDYEFMSMDKAAGWEKHSNPCKHTFQLHLQLPKIYISSHFFKIHGIG